jgi:phage/plasmid primase-like uncharacterized protein
MASTPSTWETWLEANRSRIERELKEAALVFLEAESDKKVDRLNLTGRWHYLSGKDGYIGSSGTSNKGVPYVRLTYNSFAHGGHSAKFDGHTIVKEMWESHKAGTKWSQRGHTSTRVVDEAAAKAEAEREEKAKRESVKRDLTRWETLATEGSSEYLNKKGLPHLEGIRYGTNRRGNFAALLVEGIDGTRRGLQRLYDDGSKRFTKGLTKRGAYILIGRLPKTPKHVIVCEGYATGLSIHLATGLPVLCALDAGNLRHVIAGLRKRCSASKTKITIAADNDAWNTNKLHNGRPLGNPGLKAAHNAAMHYRCKVVAPDFTGLDASNKPTDFDDLRALAGPLVVAEQLRKAGEPDPKHAFADEHHKAVKRAHGLFSGHNKTVLNARYLPDSLELKDGVNVIKSGIGSGKTEAVNRDSKANPQDRTIYISHRVSLTNDAAQRLHLDLYSDLGRDVDLAPRLAICLNSLPKLSAKNKIPHFDVVIVDEIEQLLRRLTTDIKTKTLVLDTLKHLIKNAKKVVLLDADISNVTMSLLEMWRPDEVYHCVLNERQVGIGRKLELYDSKGKVQRAAKKALKKGEKVFLVSNEKRTARQHYTLLSKTGKRGLYISGDNGDDPDVVALFANVNEESKQYDFIVASPSVSTGVSIDNGHFTWVGGTFGHLTGTPNDAMQALGRVRNTKKIHVHVDRANTQHPTDPDEISAKWTTTHAFDAELMGINSDGARGIRCADYESISLNVTRSENYARSNYGYNFLKLACINGFEFRHAKTGERIAKEAQQLEIEGKALEDAEYIETRVKATDLEPNQADKVRNALKKTFGQTRALDKHDVKQFYRLPDDADAEAIEAAIAEDDRGKLRRKIKALEIAVADQAVLKTLAENQHDESEKLAADMRHVAVENALYKRVLEAVGVDPGTLTVAAEEPYTAASMTPLVDWVSEHRRALQGVVRVPAAPQLSKEPLRFTSKILGRLGLSQKRLGKNARGEYILDDSDFERMREYLVRRGNFGATSEKGTLPAISNKQQNCPPVEVSPVATVNSVEPLPPATLSVKRDTPNLQRVANYQRVGNLPLGNKADSPVDRLRPLLDAGHLDGHPLVVCGYPHEYIGPVVRAVLARHDKQGGLHPASRDAQLVKDIIRALERENDPPPPTRASNQVRPAA